MKRRFYLLVQAENDFDGDIVAALFATCRSILTDEFRCSHLVVPSRHSETSRPEVLEAVCGLCLFGAPDDAWQETCNQDCIKFDASSCGALCNHSK